MKSIISILVFVLSVSLAHSQKYHINEDFNNTQDIISLPFWTTSPQIGEKWNVSNDVSWPAPGNQSLNGSNLAFINVSNHNSANVGYLYSPIFDNTADSLTHLTFDYNFYSDTFQLDTFFVEIYNNQQWNRIFSRTTDDCGSFIDTNCIGNFPSASIDLSTLQSKSSQLRFGYSYQANEGKLAAIDNVVVLSQKNKDLNLFATQTEFSGCEMLDSISIFLSNGGFHSAPSANISYSVNGGNSVSIGSLSNILVNDTFQLSFLANNLKHGRNEVKVFHDWQLDENKANDTVRIIIQNYIIDTYHTEGFESFEGASCTQSNAQILKNGWEVENNKLRWNLESSSCAANNQNTPNTTVPNHSNNEHFFYLASGIYNSTDSLAELYSPCIDLNNFTNPQLSFWYHKFDTSSSKIKIEVLDTNWTTVHTIQGQTQNSQSDLWKIAQVDLISYVGKNIQLRIVGERDWSHNFPNIAIDEITLYDKLNQDIGLLDIPTTYKDSCVLPSNASVQVLLANFGSQSISANSLSLELYQNDSLMQTETVSNNINTNDSLLYTFNTTLDLSSSAEHQIEIKAVLSGDTLLHNNSFQTAVYNQSVQLPYFYENFENARTGANSMDEDLNAWTRQPDTIGLHTWYVWQGPAPLIDGDPMRSIPPNGPSGDHTKATYLSNGDGKYMKLKTDFVVATTPAAHLISPCGGIDLTSSVNGKAMLSFWYHMHGNNTNDLFVDVHNGTQWVNGIWVIRGEQQWMASQPWRQMLVPLDQFTHVSNAQIRFRASGISNRGGGDIGLDDIRIFDRDTTDMALMTVTRPETSCYLNSQERLRVRLQNTGTNDIFMPELAYQLTYTDWNGQSQTHPIVSDFTIAQIMPTASYTYDFTNRLDLSQPGIYQIKVWSELSGDGYAFNDTLIHTVKNTIRPTDYCEDFNSLSINEQPNLSFGNFRNYLSNDWKVSPPVAGNQFRPTTSESNIGLSSRSGRNDDLFLYSPTPINSYYYIESPCIEIADSAKQLEFWYNVSTSSATWLMIEGNKSGYFEWVDTILVNSYQSNSWQKASVSIADYRNTLSHFRVTIADTSQQYTSSTFHFAFDDFCITDAPDQEIQLTDFPKVNTTKCDYSNQESMQFTVRNVGKNPIDSFMIISTVDTNSRKATNHYFVDTSWYYPSPSLNFDDIETYTINSTVDMSHKTKYLFSAKVVLPDEKIIRDNKINKSLQSYPPIDTNYTVDFEKTNNRLNGIKLSRANRYHWDTRRFSPVNDHTPAMNGNGYYLYANEYTNLSANDTAVFYTPCFDLSSMTTPTFSFWYHKRAQSQLADSKLLIDIKQNGTGTWQRIDSIVGNTHNNTSSPYLNKAISLSAYNNQIVQLRVSANYNNGHNIAIDDIQIIDSLITSTTKVSNVKSNNYQVYPNPSEGQFTLDVDQSFLGEVYQVHEISGKVVQEGTINSNKSRIQLNENAKGIYCLSIPNRNVREKVVVY